MRILKVEQVVRFLRELFDSNALLQDLWVQGQISSVSKSAQGHYYFTLKERDCQLNCVLFRQAMDSQVTAPINGMAAIVHGRITVYESKGVFQLVADLIQPEGVGKLHLQFEQLKQRLQREGLFDQSRKRPLPKWPRRIGVVTSPSGAVFHDIVNVIRRKYPACHIVLAPALVSGDGAAPTIAGALRALNQSRLVQLIIVARGGGSLEELWPFNDERVARAIFGSQAPVISAVGHETDVTIADLVADLRAPTPSVAAELAVPDLAAEMRKLHDYQARLQELLPVRIAELRRRVAAQQAMLERHSPLARLKHDRERLIGLEAGLHSSVQHAVALRRERVQGLERQLVLMNPYATLDRGYSITYDEAGHVLSSVERVQAGDQLAIRMSDGIVGAQATSGRTVSSHA
ncbi:MAG TPA: exodeoxyribonuclease VII large subunit [Chloroflexota bacterium]|nr:exodeoxyribonuclease VII large subunit [Chloroflexota bacterium]